MLKGYGLKKALLEARAEEPEEKIEDVLEEFAQKVFGPPIEAPEGVKYDKDKPRWDLLPFEAISSVVDVLTYGAKKYSPNNWKHVDQAEDRYFAATMRHLVARRGGEVHDPETGLPHLAHAACCILFSLYFDVTRDQG